jgi:hypothetical protein
MEHRINPKSGSHFSVRCSRSAVTAAARARIDHADLTALIYAQGLGR